jgi:hypothetical protein
VADEVIIIGFRSFRYDEDISEALENEGHLKD